MPLWSVSYSFIDWRRQQSGFHVRAATGRCFHGPIAILEKLGVPRPEDMITSIVYDIYHSSEDGV